MSVRFGIETNNVSERLHNTVRVDLEGRFMLPSKEEHPCRVLEMSTGEMLISATTMPKLDQQVIVYISELGRFEGNVERHEAAGFAVAMALSSLKHHKLAEQLVWFANRGALDLSDNRRHKRFVPLMQLTTVRLANGKERMARINDISASGVSVEINLSVSKLTILVGSHLVIGSREATVIRVFDGGLVAKFDKAFDEATIDETITL